MKEDEEQESSTTPAQRNAMIDVCGGRGTSLRLISDSVCAGFTNLAVPVSCCMDIGLSAALSAHQHRVWGGGGAPGARDVSEH